MLTTIADGLWAYEDDLRLPLGMRLPSRTTLVRLEGDALCIHSPLAIDDARARAIEAVGKPTVIVAPSCVHYLFLKAAMERWPDAKVLGAPGLEAKVKGLAFEPLPRTGPCDALGDALVVRKIEGFPYIGEHVFFHARTRTLLATDLVFNLHEVGDVGMGLFLRCVGAWRKVAQSRMWRLLLRDRAAAAASIGDVLAWDFDRVVMAHGDVLEAAARASLVRALAWATPSAPRALLPS